MIHNSSPVNFEFVDPFVTATLNVFRTMLHCEIESGALYLKQEHSPDHEINGIIGLSGKAAGAVYLSLSREVALGATEAMLGERHTEINETVVDAVGELTNMIAGFAKAQLEQLEMSMTLPEVVIDRNHAAAFPAGMTTFGIPFSTKWGGVSIEVGLCEKAPGNASTAGKAQIAV